MRTTLFFAGLLLLGGTVTAQVAVTNTGTAYIVSGTTVYINGDLTNSAAAALTNNGQLYVRQNLTNDQASMAIGTGTLHLTGSSAQSLGGSQPFRTFNLVTNNAAGVTLNANLSVSGAHTYTSGMVTTSATPNYLIYEAGSSYSGSNDSRHVNGWVKKIGNTNFTFPVGDATYERTVAISSLSAASEFNCKYNTPTTNPNNFTSSLVKVKGNEYWQIDRVSGGNAQVTLNWNHAKVPMDNITVADILVANYSAGNWTSRGGTASGNVTTTGTITSSLVSTFGPFTFGYTTYPIPLKLLSFTAERRSGSNHLKWLTENEYNVDRFEIQRSYDGIIYSAIGNVAARNTSNLQNYWFEDRSPFTGLAYYRIKSIDIDGKFSFSNIAVLSDNSLHTGDIVVLSPARNNITILNKTGKQGLFSYRLFSTNGQLLSTGNISMGMNGGAILTLPSIMSSGTCILEVSQGAERFTKRILIQ